MKLRSIQSKDLVNLLYDVMKIRQVSHSQNTSAKWGKLMGIINTITLKVYSELAPF